MGRLLGFFKYGNEEQKRKKRNDRYAGDAVLLQELSRSNLQTYREIFWIDLRQLSYRKIYPPEEHQEAGTYSKLVEDHFVQHRVSLSREETIKKMLNPQNIQKALMNQNVIEHRFDCYCADGTLDACHVSVLLHEKEGDLPVSAFMTIRSIENLLQADIFQYRGLIHQLEFEKHSTQAIRMSVDELCHNIRTPMNAILGYTEMAKMDPENTEKMIQCLDKISVAGNHMMATANAALGLDMLEKGVFLDMQCCNIQDLIREIKDLLWSEITMKQYEISLDISGFSQTEIWCDPMKIKQVVMNCLWNSMSFTPNGGRIKVSVREKRAVGTSASLRREAFEIVIQDDGTPMPQEYLKHINEPYSGEKLLSAVETGNGLEMTFARRMIECMHGEIRVKRLEDGNEYHITLPLITMRKDAMYEALVSNAQNTIRGLKVLVADDEDINAELIASTLRAFECEVFSAKDGESCIEMLKQGITPDVILMDLRMPKMNGYEAASRIRHEQSLMLSSIPMIAMSSDISDGNLNKMKKAGFDFHVEKPVNLKKLLRVLGEIRA